MESESNVKESSNAGQFQICGEGKSTYVKIPTSQKTASVLSNFQFGSPDQLPPSSDLPKPPPQPSLSLVSLDKIKIPKRTAVNLVTRAGTRTQEKSTSLRSDVKEVADGSCPLCGQTFSSLTRLENHASRCKGRLAKV